jgi:hypothetical protein
VFTSGARAGAQTARSLIGDDLPGQASSAAGAGVASNAPFEHPMGKGGGEPISLPDPPIFGALKATASHAPDAQKMSDEAQGQLGSLGQEMAGALRRTNAPDENGNVGVIPNRNEKEIFVLEDMRSIFEARIGELDRRVLEPQIQEGVILGATTKLGELGMRMVPEVSACRDEACTRRVELKYCKLRHALAADTHGRFMPLWTSYWTATRTNLMDYDAFSRRWLEDLREPTAHAAQDYNRRTFILTHAAKAYALAASEAEFMAQATEDDCVQYQDAPVNWDPKPLQVFGVAPARECRPKGATFFLSVDFLKLEASCEKFKIELKESVPGANIGQVKSGGFGSLEYKFGKNGKSDRMTLFTGEYAEAGDQVKGTLKVGGYLSVDMGDPPSLADVGVRAEASITHERGADLDPTGLTPGVGASKTKDYKATVQLGIENGLDVDFSTSTKVGLKLKGILKGED